MLHSFSSFAFSEGDMLGIAAMLVKAFERVGTNVANCASAYAQLATSPRKKVEIKFVYCGVAWAPDARHELIE